ncbi:MAG: tripartite tricarboxylate transporter permease [Nitriliruptoraceae bacterium]|nr:tripartite tricarboxylate transporter permease [Nitriliruptoraceae bacterium]
MLQAATEALLMIFTPDRMLFLVLGTLIGVVVGALPGLGGVVGMSLLLPFIFGMDTFDGVALMMGMIAVVHTADTFPSVLLGAPGSAGSQATIMDGYPLARQGQAARALAAAFTSSLLGGIIGAFTLFMLLNIARPLVLLLTSPRLFMLGLFGLATVGVLVRGSALTGVLSALAGLLLGAVGASVTGGVYRYTFDSIYLFDGVPLAIIALALFAIPEIIDLLISGEAVSKDGRGGKLRGGMLRGVRDAFGNKFLVTRSAVLGTAVGMIPGLGSSVVDWLAYGVAERTTRGEKNFGDGDIRGVIAPESANNAKEGGALVPTLLFGIPGSATNAILMGGLLLLGIQVGPTMLTTDLNVTLGIVWTLALANVAGTIACFLLVGPIARVTFIPARQFMPFLIVLITIAAYQSSGNWGDIVALLVLGFTSWLMKRAGWPRAPLLIGAVLSGNLERYLSISANRYGTEWLTDPFVMVMAVLCLLMILGGSARTGSKDDEIIEEALDAEAKDE